MLALQVLQAAKVQKYEKDIYSGYNIKHVHTSILRYSKTLITPDERKYMLLNNVSCEKQQNTCNSG